MLLFMRAAMRPCVVAACAAMLSACGGGPSTTGMPPASGPSGAQPSSVATATYKLSSAAATYAIPPFAGYSGTIGLPQTTVPPGATMTLTTSLKPPAGAPSAAEKRPANTGTFNLYMTETVTYSIPLSYPTLPALTIALPSTVNPAGLLFFYAISNPTPTNGAGTQFRTEGPATISGRTLTFAPSPIPWNVVANQAYTIEIYAISSPTETTALWVANGTNVLEFVPSQLQPGITDPAPHFAINSTVFGAPQGVQFDAAGDLWVIDGGNGGTAKPALYEFSPAQLAALGTNAKPTPMRTIKSAALVFPQQGVFDAAGDFWVADNGADAVYEFTPAQLAAGGANVTPNTTITSNPAFNGPLGIAFGPTTGDLWIANNATTTIFGFAAPLPTSGAHTLVPHTIISDDGAGSVQGPWALVFDAFGNLWSSNANAPDTIVEFLATQLGTTGKPVPHITISPRTLNGNSTLAAPNGLAFDNLGNLSAVSSAAPFGIPVYAQSQFTVGPIAPAVFIVGGATTLNAPAGDVFGPAVY